MQRAAVPEASVNKDGDPSPSEHDIRPDHPTCIRTDRKVLSEAEASAVQGRAKSDLGLRVALPVAPHHGRNGAAAGPWIAHRSQVRGGRRAPCQTRT
jgi:hypothetical protein